MFFNFLAIPNIKASELTYNLYVYNIGELVTHII